MEINTDTCRERILGYLSMLDANHDTVQKFLEIDQECVARLERLEDGCSQEILAIANEMLESLSAGEDNEYKIQVIIRAMYKRNEPTILDFIRGTLRHEGAVDKETYVTYLVDMADPRIIPLLIEFLESEFACENEEGTVIVKAIDALRAYRAKEAIEAVIARINDKSSLVREAATNFLRELEVKTM